WKYLAIDELTGRGMGQRGSELVEDYIGKQLESYGLKPAGDSGTYFQSVPMVGVKTLPQTTFEAQRDGGETLSLKNLDDFVTNNESQTETADFPHRLCSSDLASRRRNTTGTIIRITICM